MLAGPDPEPGVRRVLVVGPSWIGDAVMAQSLFMVLRDRDPEIVIDVLAPAWSVPVLARMPEVSTGFASPFAHGELGIGARRSAGKKLQKNRYDLAIVLPRSFKSALIPFFAKIPQRVGYRGEMRYGLINDIRMLDKSELRQTVQRFVALGLDRDETLPSQLPKPRLAVDDEAREGLMRTLSLNLDRPIVAFLPGAEYGPAKQWPSEHFARLAGSAAAAGYSVWIVGSEKERSLGASIERDSRGAALNLCGKTTLVEAIDLISMTDAVVSNDSGLMHIAAAVGTRVIAIYGSSSPSYTPPLTDKASIMHLGIECSPCFDRVCRYGHYRCLREISAGDVMAVLEKSDPVVQ